MCGSVRKVYSVIVRKVYLWCGRFTYGEEGLSYGGESLSYGEEGLIMVRKV